MCVSHPGQRVLPHHSSHFTQAGGQCTTDRHCPTKTLSARGEAMRDAALCTCRGFSTSCHPTFPRFDSWFFMILPQNLPFAAFVLQLGRADRSFSRLDQQLVETPTSLSDSSPCRSIAFFPIETIALTENPSSKCVLLSRPTRVLSVIPVTGAPFLRGKATTPTHHRSLELHRKAPTPSQNQPPHRPPGQKTVLEKSLRFRISDFRFRHSAFFSWFPVMCAFLCS